MSHKTKFRQVNETQFNTFISQHNLTEITNQNCQELQNDYIDANKTILATHEMIACQDIFQIAIDTSSELSKPKEEST